MLDRLIDAIENYIKYLRKTGLYVTVHGDISEYIHSLPEIDIHSNPFCLMIKTEDCAWCKCIQSQQKIYNQNSSKPFWGMCYAGIEEYVFPLCSSSEIFGFVCVSGYAVNKKEAMRRINTVSKEFMINCGHLQHNFRRY